PAFEWVHVQLHQQKGMISLSPPTICNSALRTDVYNLQIQQRNDTQALQREVQKSRPIGVCYLDGQPYSQGAVIAGRICASNGVIVNGRPTEVSWQVYHRR
ncbi:hypothetical protein ABQ354_22835, partial [Citrobacter freundii]